MICRGNSWSQTTPSLRMTRVAPMCCTPYERQGNADSVKYEINTPW